MNSSPPIRPTKSLRLVRAIYVRSGDTLNLFTVNRLSAGPFRGPKFRGRVFDLDPGFHDFPDEFIGGNSV